MSAESERVAELFESVQKNARIYVERRAKLRAFFDSVEKSLNACEFTISMNTAIRLDDKPGGTYWALAWRRAEDKEAPTRWGLFIERWQPNADGQDVMKERVTIQSAPRELRIFAALRFERFIELVNERLQKELNDLGAAVASIEGFLAEFGDAASTSP